METLRMDSMESIEDINLDLEKDTLPSTEEMLLILQEDPTRCLSWL